MSSPFDLRGACSSVTLIREDAGSSFCLSLEISADGSYAGLFDSKKEMNAVI